MKILIAPTDAKTQALDSSASYTVTMEHPSDDLNVTEAFRLLSLALVAYGYHPKNVRDCLDESLANEFFGSEKLLTSN